MWRGVARLQGRRLVRTLSTEGQDKSPGGDTLRRVSQIIEDDPKRAELFARALDEKSRAALGAVVSSLANVKAAQPTSKMLFAVALGSGIPFIGFGFMDNLIMIVAGDAIDSTIGVTIGITTLAAAGLGNLLSDLGGFGVSGVIETACEKVLPPAGLSRQQLKMARTKRWTLYGSMIGCSIGCLLGMFPLLFIDPDKTQTLKRAEGLATFLQDVVDDTRVTLGADRVVCFLIEPGKNNLSAALSTKNAVSFPGDGDNKVVDISELNIPVMSGAIGTCVRSGEIVTIKSYDDHNAEHYFDTVSDAIGYEMHNAIYAPVHDLEGNVIAIVQASNKSGAEFNTSDRRALSVLCPHISVALLKLLGEERRGVADAMRLAKSSMGKEATDLCALTFEGDLDGLMVLVEGGGVKDVNQADYDLRTCLHLAAAEGHADIVAYLLDVGADATALDRWGRTPMEDAFVHHQEDVLAVLRAEGERLSDAFLRPRMVAACATGDEHELHLLMENADDAQSIVNTPDDDGQTVLHVAASKGHADIVSFLIASGADISAEDRRKKTPMAVAVERQHSAATTVLRTAGALLPDEYVRVHMTQACSLGDLPAVRMFVEVSADPKEAVQVVDKSLRSYLHLAATMGHASVAEYLMYCGANVNARDRWGHTPLDDALSVGNMDVVSLLRLHGGVFSRAFMKARLLTAAAHGDVDVVDCLVSTSSNPRDSVRTCGDDGKTALHLAVAEGHVEVVKYLLRRGGDPAAVDKAGLTPRMEAQSSGNTEMLALLT